MDFIDVSNLPDKRLQNQSRKMVTLLQNNQCSIINRSYGSQRDKIGGYRFLNNIKIEEEHLIKALNIQCQLNCGKKHIIGIQDTSEYNYAHHRKRIKDGSLGVVGNNRDLGYFAHVMVLFDAETHLPQGISYCKLWSREPERKTRDHEASKKLPIEEKESYRWLEAIDKTRSLLNQSSHFTFISDRESDIYQLWSKIPDEKTDLIIRARGDRLLFDQPLTMIESLDKDDIAGSFRIELKGDTRVNKSKRTALLHVKFKEVLIKKAKGLSLNHDVSENVSLMLVEAKEDPSTCKEGQTPVHWLLLTTHDVRTFEQACNIIIWYCFRWQIEQFFRITKLQGINLEASQLETGVALKKLGLIGFAAALKILQLSLARDGTHNDHANKYFSTQEIQVLGLLDKKLRGTTIKQQNPHSKCTLAWAAWVIARLGGYSGYASQSPPGPMTFKWGLDKFNQIVEAYYLFGIDVYKE
ncbi:MAG: IS4 family transposase [Bacteroidetes bacterium]|nr:IS4 family transposase [Bacteroidota bacterium]